MSTANVDGATLQYTERGIGTAPRSRARRSRRRLGMGGGGRALIAGLRLDDAVVVGWSDGGQVAMEPAVRHPGAAQALVVGGAFPEFDDSGLRETHRALMDELERGTDEELGDLPAQHTDWPALLSQTRAMWLDYEGLTDDRRPRDDRPPDARARRRPRRAGRPRPGHHQGGTDAHQHPCLQRHRRPRHGPGAAVLRRDPRAEDVRGVRPDVASPPPGAATPSSTSSRSPRRPASPS